MFKEKRKALEFLGRHSVLRGGLRNSPGLCLSLGLCLRVIESIRFLPEGELRDLRVSCVCAETVCIQTVLNFHKASTPGWKTVSFVWRQNVYVC